ncbi:MAG: TonB-dependent receptor, partial [Bacteroidota bacterium]
MDRFLPPHDLREPALCSAWATRLVAVVALLCLVGFTASEAAAQYGKIQGTVTDAATGEPLPGVNVVIDGSTQGAATDFDGQYVIIGVRPGTYTVSATFIGYQTKRIEGVRVRIDLTTPLDFELPEEVFEGQEVVVTAERELIQKDLTATTAFVSGDEIRALPVENFDQVVELQAGVIDGHFRGGRLGEVGYWVDGMPVTDVFSGGRSVEIENNAVDELQVVTGAFNAEYGQAMSGIVNVVTRDGSNDFEGSFSGFIGDYGTSGTEIFRELDEINVVSVANAEASLSGPILKDRLFFATSGRFFRNEGWINGYDVFNADYVGFNANQQIDYLPPGVDFTQVDSAVTAISPYDSAAVSLNPYDRYSGQAKLTFRLTDKIRIAANALGSFETFKSGDPQAFFFFPDALLDAEQRALTSYLKFTHLVSNETFYEAGITRIYTDYSEALFDDPLDERYRDNRFFGARDDRLTRGFIVGGTNNNRFERSTETWLFKADVTSQVNRTNLIKFGVEGRYHTLDFLDQETLIQEENGERFSAFLNTDAAYTYNPIELSAYIQDKIEIGGLIINAGIRFDYFNSNGRVFADPTDVEAVTTDRRVYIEENGVRVDQVLDEDVLFPDELFADAETHWQFSPRLGVAFPISEGGVIHFSYGQFFQIPNFELLYQNPFFSLGSGGSGLQGLIGNAGLAPEQTINGEIGLKQELSSSSSVELTAYYRDIRNLAGSDTDPIQVEGTSIRYGQLINSDFGFVRGIIFRFDQRIGTSLFAGLDYTFQVARANSSDPAQVYNAAANRQSLETQIVPTGWDQRHTLAASLNYTNLALDAGFSLLVTYGSGRPYTPTFTTQQTGELVPGTIPLNSEIRPATSNVNLSVYKNFDVAGT